MDQNLSFMELMSRVIALEQEVEDMKIRIARLENLTPNAKPKLSKKYMKLTEFLKDQQEDEVVMSFEDIEKILGHKLPPSAYNQASFWANTLTHTNALGWIGAGFEVDEIHLKDKEVKFRRMQQES